MTHEPMTERQLSEIRARAEAATPGPWTNGLCIDFASGQRFGTGPGCATHSQAEHDATFIAHARQDVPALLAEVERLRAALVDVSDLADWPVAEQEFALTRKADRLDAIGNAVARALGASRATATAERRSAAVAEACKLERERCAAVADKWGAQYPESVFPADGSSAECQSAAMARHVARGVAEDIRAMPSVSARGDAEEPTRRSP